MELRALTLVADIVERSGVLDALKLLRVEPDNLSTLFFLILSGDGNVRRYVVVLRVLDQQPLGLLASSLLAL
jgi:hypothetical protein